MSKGNRIKSHLTNDERTRVNHLAREIKDCYFTIASLTVQMMKAQKYDNPVDNFVAIHEKIQDTYKEIKLYEEEIVELAMINDTRKAKQNGKQKQKDFHRYGKPKT